MRDWNGSAMSAPLPHIEKPGEGQGRPETPPGVPVRVVVADDHDLARRELIRALTADPRIVVIGEAADGEDAVALARELKPDVVLMDIRMPGVDGLEALRRIRATGDSIVVLCSVYMDRQYNEAARRLGAAGYVPKSSDEAEIVNAVLAAATGQRDPRPQDHRSTAS